MMVSQVSWDRTLVPHADGGRPQHHGALREGWLLGTLGEGKEQGDPAKGSSASTE